MEMNDKEEYVYTEDTIPDDFVYYHQCCETCAQYYKFQEWAYGNNGCEHNEMPGFICMVFGDERLAVWLNNLDPKTAFCECYSRREGK